MLRTALLGGNTITLDADLSKYIETVSDQGVIEGLEVGSNSVAPGKAWVKATRSNGETIMVLVQNTEVLAVDTSGTKKIWLEIRQEAIDNGLLNNEDGTGIASIKTGPTLPSQNFLLLASVADGVVKDERNLIPKIQSVAQKTSVLEEKLSTAEGKIEQIENGGPTNFLILRELGENIEAGKAYFVGDGVDKNVEFTSEEISPGSHYDSSYSFNSGSYQYLKIIRNNGHVEPLGESIFLQSSGRYKSISAGVFSSFGNAGYNAGIEHRNGFNTGSGGGTQSGTFDLWGKEGKNYGITWNDSSGSGSYAYYPLLTYKNIGKKRRTSTINISGYHSVSFNIQKIGNPGQLKKSFVFNDSGLTNISEGQNTIIIPKGEKKLYLRLNNLSVNDYYVISDVILHGFSKGKKFVATVDDDGNGVFTGIEKKGGNVGEATHGAEMGMLEINKPDGYYYLGSEGDISTIPNNVYIGEIKNGYLKLSPEITIATNEISNTASTGNIVLGNAEGFLTVYVKGKMKKIPLYGF